MHVAYRIDRMRFSAAPGRRDLSRDRQCVTDPATKDEDDRKLAAEMSSYLQSELVRRLRDTGIFQRVVNLREAEFKPEADKALRPEGMITRPGRDSRAARAFFEAYGAGRT